MTIAELLEELGNVKHNANSLYSQYKELKDQEDTLKIELMAKLRDSGLKSAKGKDFTASIAERTDIVITSEPDLLGWLQNTPDIEADFYIGVKKPKFTAMARSMLKNTGELADGTQLQLQETLSIRSNNAKKPEN